MQQGKVRRPANQLSELANRVVEPAFVLQDCRKIASCGHESGVEAKGVLKSRLGLVPLASVSQDRPERAVGQSEIRLQLDRPAASGDRLVSAFQA